MNNKTSPEARARWDELSFEEKNQLLINVWCSQCRKAVRILDFSLRIEDDDLIFEGSCNICNNKVVRLVEGG